jgi:plastocyanin
MTPSLRRVILVFGAAVALLGCGSAGGPAASAPPGGVVITANNIAFDRTELVIPADVPFQLLFENRESAPHNVTLFSGEGGEPLFTGEVFSGAGSRMYDVPAIPLGAYRFRCDVHPEMAGAVVAQSPSDAGSPDSGPQGAAAMAIDPAPQPAPAPPSTLDVGP